MPADSLIYLASPYSHPRLSVRRARVKANAHFCALMQHNRLHVYSPLVHNHTIWEEYPNRRLAPEYDSYIQWGLDMIERSNSLWVLMLSGYSTSLGVKTEVGHARRLGLPVSWIIPTRPRDWNDPFYDAYCDVIVP